jgi:exosortase
MVWLHFTRMWNAEHFQFFPVALVATAVLAHSRRTDIVAAATPPKRWVVWIGLGIIGFTSVLATLLGFALTGWLSFVAFLALMVYSTYGFGGLWASAPVWLMLLVIKPVPTFLEQFLTINMQKGASSLAGNLLNLMGIVHYQQGVVLRLVGQSFLAEEACSGIRSLFSSIAAITFLGFMNRYHWFRHLVNIAQTIIWVVVLNAFRIAAVIYVEDQTEYSIASGFAHELFGYVVFFAIFGLVLSTDRLFAAVVLPALRDSPEDVPGMPSHWTDSLNWPGGLMDGVVLTSTFLLVAFLSIRMLTRVPDYKPMFGEPLPIAERDFITSELSGWQMVDFRHQKRTEHDLQGAESFIWELKKDDKMVLLSLDGSFNDFHDLEWCYSALGWDCKSNRLYTSIADRAQGKVMPDGEFTHIGLEKNTGETGHVVFAAIDRNGVIVVPPPGINQEAWSFISQSLLNAGRYAFGLSAPDDFRAATFEGPVSTLQLVYYPRDPIEDEELEELKKLFLLAREQLRKTSRFLPG